MIRSRMTIGVALLPCALSLGAGSAHAKRSTMSGNAEEPIRAPGAGYRVSLPSWNNCAGGQ